MMKNNQIAESFLVKAHASFENAKNREALENFNQTLRFAATKSELIADAFFGRAKVYCQMKQYQKCIDNIQNAIQFAINDEKLKTYKILQDEIQLEISSSTEEDSKVRQQQENENNEFFSLSHDAHKKIPFIAECLDVKENDIYGRYIMTNKDLKPGDIVVVEEPFYKVTDMKIRHTRCSVCLKQNLLDLLPCSKCSTAMFCSKKCNDSVIHRYECTAPKEENFEKMLLQRMFYQAVEITGSLDELQKLLNRNENTTSKTIMDYDFGDENDEMKDKNRVLATTSLAEREPWNAEAYAKYESVTEQLKTQNDDERDFVRSYLVKCLKSMTVNFFHFFWSTQQREGQGFALCSFAAYFIHSCDPNVDKIDVDNKFVFVARKPIKAGDQLFMNYDRYSFLTHPITQRLEYFDRVYTFKCACPACSNDYPMLNDLKKIDNSFMLKKIDEMNTNEAIEQFKNNCKYIEDNMKFYPCYEVCSLMTQNVELLHQIGNSLMF